MQWPQLAGASAPCLWQENRLIMIKNPNASAIMEGSRKGVEHVRAGVPAGKGGNIGGQTGGQLQGLHQRQTAPRQQRQRSRAGGPLTILSPALLPLQH